MEFYYEYFLHREDRISGLELIISNSIFKKWKNEYIGILVNLINFTIDEGGYSELLKMKIVISCFKEGKPTLIKTTGHLH